MRSSTLLAIVACIAVGTSACSGQRVASSGPASVQLPVTDGMAATSGRAPARTEAPPPAGTSREAPFPAVRRSTLPNGLGLAVVTAPTLPLVHVRVFIRAGAGYDKPGVAMVTASMLKDGGTRDMTSAELLKRIETLGATLSVRTTFDGTIVSTSVTTDLLDETLALVSRAIREPRFDGDELAKLKSRMSDEAEDTARSSGTWTATRLVFRELYGAGTAYGTYGLVPSEIAAVDGAKIRSFHRRFYVPKATSVVLAGDIDEATAKSLTMRHFGEWASASDPPKVTFSPARIEGSATRVFVANRPKSAQSDVYVALVAPPRKSENWPAIRVANQVLGGGVASRLFMDVREERSLAYRTNAQVLELAHGEQPLVLYAGTESKKTSLAVTGLLENLDRMGSSPPSTAETESARRFLSDILSIRMETVGAIADMVVTEIELGLSEGYWDAYRKRVRSTTPSEVSTVGKMYSARKAVFVSGDAETIAPDLARFGEVVVVDPEKEFRVVKTIPQTAVPK